MEIARTYYENGNIKTEAPLDDGEIMGIVKGYDELWKSKK